MRIKTNEIKPGDIIHFLGRPHLIDRIDEYTGPHDFITGIARAADGWGISLDGVTLLDVSRVDSLVSVAA